MNYDWLASARAQFSRLSLNLPHALLIQGESGVGKHVLAKEMVASLLCEQPSVHDEANSACGECKNCTMFASGNHPDFHYISSERFVESADSSHLTYAERYLETPEKRGKRKPRKVITVDQIRTLIDNFNLSNHSAETKVALIEPADAMNINAANALLKLLEEPSADSVLILICKDVSRLPMTIRSRCIALSIDPPSTEQAVSCLVSEGIVETTAHKALAICGGAPLAALACARSEEVNNFEVLIEALAAYLNEAAGPVATRDVVVKLQSLERLISWLQMLVSWLISAAQNSGPAGQPSGEAPWQAYSRTFSKLSRRLDASKLPALFLLYDELALMKQQDLDIINPGLLLDRWLISFSRAIGKC